MAQRQILVFCHGSGDTGPGIQQWIKDTLPNFESQLAAEGIDCMFPSAPRRPYTMAGGNYSSVWFDRQALEPGSPEDASGVQASVELVERCIEESGAVEVAVCGMSQGGCLALHLGLRKRSIKTVACVCLSSFLPDNSAAIAAADAGSTPNILMCHGTADEMVPHTWGEKTSNLLRTAGHSVSWQTYPGLGHDMSSSELKKVLEFVLPRFTARA